MTRASSNRTLRVQIITPAPGNYFYQLVGRRFSEALRQLGAEVYERSLHTLEDGLIDWCIIINPAETVYEYVEYQKAGSYEQAAHLLNKIRQTSKQFDMLLMECVETRWFQDSYNIFRQVPMDRFIDVGFHSQASSLDINNYTFVFNGLTQSEQARLLALSEIANYRPIPWLFIGLTSPERLSLIDRLVCELDAGGFVYLLNQPEPIRSHGPHINHEQFNLVQRHTRLSIWCSHHPHFYVEAERFREALLAGSLPIKVLLDDLPSDVTLPFSYLLLPYQNALDDLGEIQSHYTSFRRRFTADFIALPSLESEVEKLLV